MIVSKQIEVLSDGHFNVVNITGQVSEALRESGIVHGQALVFYQHTTGSVIVGEFEAGITADMMDMFERIAPTRYPYKHHIRDVDFNGHAHVRSALMTSQVTIPVINGKLAMGTYQEILMIDDQVDNEPRYLVVQITGETQ